MRGQALTGFRALNQNRLNPTAINTLVDIISPFYTRRQYPTYNFMFRWFIMPILTTVCFQPVLSILIRIVLGLVLSSLGVMWSETLSGLPYLKDLAKQFLGKFEEVSTISIPNSDDSQSFMHYIQLFLLSILAFFFFAGVLDHYYPDISRDIPVIHSTAEHINSTWDYIKSLFNFRGGSSGGN